MKKLEHVIGNHKIIYLIDEMKKTSFFILPYGIERKMTKFWEKECLAVNAGASYNPEWQVGSLVHLHLRHHYRSNYNGVTMKFSESVENLCFYDQRVEKNKECSKIITILKAEEGYEVYHTITWIHGRKGLICETEFYNNGTEPVVLEMLTSFSLDNLSPFQKEDGRNKIHLHRFRGGWSLEGKHISDSMEELALEKAWCAPFLVSEKFGSAGSLPVNRFFPMAGIEDSESGIFWMAQLEHNGTWQMEVTRYKDTVSFSGGIGDAEFGAWSKTIEPRESFCAPRAFLCASDGDIYQACQDVVDMQNIACDIYGEKGLLLVFNEFCSTWGKPEQEKMKQYAEILKGKGIKYLVIDAGWSKDGDDQRGNGEWLVNKERFPDMKYMNQELRNMGFVPSIWMEFEVTTKGSPMYGKEYDSMHLKRNGVIINCGGWRTFWDFRRGDVREYLAEHVISFLKDNGFGYLKVDYNGSVGIGCDDKDSLGEGLRQHLLGVKEFFQDIKRQIPEIIIENCSSGGHRLEPMMLGVSAMSSFSDAHESLGAPCIAANEHCLLLPRQCQIWVVIKAQQSLEEICYRLSTGFLGRICLSGEIEKISAEQWSIVEKGIQFYKKAEDILLHGISRIYGKRGDNIQHPQGTQVLIRETKNEMLIVCHGFEDTNEQLEIPLAKEYIIAEEFNNYCIHIIDMKIVIHKMKEWTGCAVLLVKR